jgi:thymidylate synthase ThyX
MRIFFWSAAYAAEMKIATAVSEKIIPRDVMRIVLPDSLL